nr:MAG TPA: hypothetical protein [Caudoviricetes sp.]
MDALKRSISKVSFFGKKWSLHLSGYRIYYLLKR